MRHPHPLCSISRGRFVLCPVEMLLTGFMLHFVVACQRNERKTSHRGDARHFGARAFGTLAFGQSSLPQYCGPFHDRKQALHHFSSMHCCNGLCPIHVRCMAMSAKPVAGMGYVTRTRIIGRFGLGRWFRNASFEALIPFVV
jgi:hypothetical protein